MITSSSRARRVIAGAAVAGLTALATGCEAAPTPTAAAPSASASVTPAAGGSAAAAAATAAAPTASSMTQARVPPCPTRYLQAKVGLTQGTAGSTYTVLDFTNISTSTCTLYGYPGVSFAGGTPVNQIGLAAAESKTAPRQLVTLAPGAVGNALLHIVHAADFPANVCHPVTAQYLTIYPPNQTTPIYLAFTYTTCSAPLQILTIGVIEPGSGGSA